MRRGVTVGRRGPGLVGTMARTAVVATTATVAVGATKSVMGGGSSKQAAAQQDAAQDQQMADLQAQQAELAAQQEALAQQQVAAQQVPAGPDPGSLDYQANEIRKLQVMKDQGLIDRRGVRCQEGADSRHLTANPAEAEFAVKERQTPRQVRIIGWARSHPMIRYFRRPAMDPTTQSRRNGVCSSRQPEGSRRSDRRGIPS